MGRQSRVLKISGEIAFTFDGLFDTRFSPHARSTLSIVSCLSDPLMAALWEVARCLALSNDTAIARATGKFTRQRL